MGNIAVTAWPKVQIETSDDNLKKISELLKTLQSGELDGQVIRPPMQVGEIVKLIGVTRNTFHLWKNGEVMPQPANLRAIAVNLLRVAESDLVAYFAGAISLKDLLAIRVKAATPDDVFQTFQALKSDREKDAVLALLLQQRAQKLGNDSMSSHGDFFSPEPSTPKNSTDSRILDGKKSEKTDQAMYQFEYLAFGKLKNLMEASRNQLKLSEVGYIRAAAANGITLDEASLFFEDVMDETYTRSHPVTRIEAFLPLLFRLKNPARGFSLDLSRTYANDFQGLIRDLSQLGNGATQQPVHH